MGKISEYRCGGFPKANYESLVVLVEYLMTPPLKRHTIFKDSDGVMHESGIDQGRIFELLLHVPDCVSCKKYYLTQLKIQTSLQLHKTEDEKNPRIKNERVRDLAARTREAWDLIIS